jgi:predicted oxidoreductase
MYAPQLPKVLGRYDGWSEDNREEIERGWILRADTLEELTQKMQQVDPSYMVAENLSASVEAYRAACEAGEDVAFGREPATMEALSEEGPFYSWPVYPGGCSTLGGPKKNENAQVLDTYDQPIPRLYAAGCFGNFAANTYGISGGNNAENMVWGRIAARHVSALDDWES